MKVLDLLLENYWITKAGDKDTYYYVRDHIQDVRDFLAEKLGYQLIVNQSIVKLEKMPGIAEPWMGIEGFEDKMEYAFLCILLMFLEDKSVGEQFLLSQLTEYIEGALPGNEKVDWTLFRHRKHLVKVIRFALETGIVNANDGSESDFAGDIQAEALYENSGLSIYFMKHFTGNLMSYSTLRELEEDEWCGVDKERGKIRRNRVYRRLIMSPAVYCEGSDDQDYLYIKNFKGMLQSDMEDRLSSQLHIHKSGAFVILGADKNYRDVFPDNKTISDIALQLNTLICEGVADSSLKVGIDDTIVMSQTEFENLVKFLRQRFQAGWSKEYREMANGRLCEQILGYMKSFSMISIESYTGQVKIMPACGKIAGRYPESFIENDIKEGANCE